MRSDRAQKRNPERAIGGGRYRGYHWLIPYGLILILLGACAQARPTITLALLGDINLGRGVQPGTTSLAYLAPELHSADLVLANLESPLAPQGFTPAPGEGYNLCAPDDRATLLADWGIDVLSLANNHSLDCAPDGPNMTQSALESAGLTPLGPDLDPVYRTVNGVKLAFLALDDISSPLDTDAAVQAIRTARATGAVVIVAVHWGIEYQGGASSRQQTLSRDFADAGAALIAGSHPHVLQRVEWIHLPPGSKPGGSATLVIYSLGNALFDQQGLEDTRRSALILVKMDANGVQSVQATPFMIDAAHSQVVQADAIQAQIIQDRLQIP